MGAPADAGKPYRSRGRLAAATGRAARCELECAVRISLASALVGLEIVGGPIEDAKLSRSHIRMEITRDADVEAIKQRLQALVDDVLSPEDDETSN